MEETRLKSLEAAIRVLTHEAAENKARMDILHEAVMTACDHSVDFQEAKRIMSEAALKIKRTIR